MTKCQCIEVVSECVAECPSERQRMCFLMERETQHASLQIPAELQPSGRTNTQPKLNRSYGIGPSQSMETEGMPTSWSPAQEGKLTGLGWGWV